MTRFLVSLTLLLSISISAQQLKSPSEFLGYELGTEFTRHHEVVDIMNIWPKPPPTG